MLKFSIFLFFPPPPSIKKNLKENIEIFKKILFIYFFEKYFLKLAAKVCSFFLIN
jgi:hypothetical protein